MTRQPTPGVYESYREPGEFGEGVTVRRPCTCHPDDAPPVPCAERYALSECKTAVTHRIEPATDRQIALMKDFWAYYGGPPHNRLLNVTLLKRDFLSLIARLEEPR